MVSPTPKTHHHGNDDEIGYRVLGYQMATHHLFPNPQSFVSLPRTAHGPVQNGC